MPRLQKITAAVSAIALIGAGAMSAAQAATTSGDGAPGSRSERPGPKRGGGPLSSARLAAIAGTLGVTSAQLKAALDASRPARPTGARPDPGAGMATVKAAFDKIHAAHEADHSARDAAMYAAVAEKLGLSADAVKAAFEANRPARRAPRTP